MGTEATLQKQARALGDPTRHSIFNYLDESRRPVSVSELTEHFGLNHNAIRQHLSKLVGAGLVTKGTARSGTPGRPRLLYEVHPGAGVRWGAADPYQTLSLLLVDMINTSASAEEAGRRAGRQLAGESPSGGDPIVSITNVIARGGFEPRVRTSDNSVEYILGNCPFAEAATGNPEIVCRLHLGLAEGLAGQLPGVTVDSLVRKEPQTAGCRLTFDLAPIDEEDGST